MPFIKTLSEKGVCYFNTNQITRIEEENDHLFVGLSDGIGLILDITLEELVRKIKEAENAK